MPFFVAMLGLFVVVCRLLSSCGLWVFFSLVVAREPVVCSTWALVEARELSSCGMWALVVPLVCGILVP